METPPSAYVIFLMQDTNGQQRSDCTWHPLQNIIRLANWSARNLQVRNTDVSSHRVAVHVEIMVVYAKSQCSFATYADRPMCAWQSFDETFYNAQDWIAVPLCQGFEAVANLVQVCQNNIRSPYSFTRYLCSTNLFAWTVHILDDRDNAPAHCGGLTARVLKRIGALDNNVLAPTFSPQKLLNTMRLRGAVQPICAAHVKRNVHGTGVVRYECHTSTQASIENQEAFFSSLWIKVRMNILDLNSKCSPSCT